MDHPDHSPHRDRLASLMARFVDTVIVSWVHGEPTAVTERWAATLPHPSRRDVRPWFVITADDPNGRTTERSDNARTLGNLLSVVAEIATTARRRSLRTPVAGIDASAALPPAPIVWWPAVGSSVDGTHAEMSVMVLGIDRAAAIDLGRRFDQLAVFELTDELQTVVPCIEGIEPASVPRRRRSHEPCAIGFDHLEAWWTSLALAARSHEVELSTRPRCRRCGSHRLAHVQYGMPALMPPPWVALGGCIVRPGNPHTTCKACSLDD